MTQEPGRFDAVTVDDLRARGSLKWTAFPDALGGFVAEMDFGLAPEIVDALRAGIADQITGYLPQRMLAGMQAATSGFLQRRYGWAVDADDVHPLGDVLAGLELAIRFHSRHDAPVIVPTPAYMPFLTLPGSLGRPVIEVPCVEVDGRPALDLDGIADAFAAGANLLVLCNPVNPLGRVYTREELVAVSEVVDTFDGRVFADEVHAPLVYPGATHIPYASVNEVAAAHTVTTTSASKAFNLAGLKCAQFITSNPDDREIFAATGTWASHGASTFGVAANTAAYEHGEAWLGEVVAELDANRRGGRGGRAERIPGIGYRAPEGTYIGWLDCRALELETTPADFFLREAGVALTDGAACGEAGAGHVRLVFATPRPVVERMVDAMARALDAR